MGFLGAVTTIRLIKLGVKMLAKVGGTMRKASDRSIPLFENQIADRWFTTKEAADYLRVSPKRLLNLASNGLVPFHKLGRSNRYLERELKELLLVQSIGGTNGL